MVLAAVVLQQMSVVWVNKSLTTICWLWCCSKGENRLRRCCRGVGSEWLGRRVHSRGERKSFNLFRVLIPSWK
jgi:hypothetical protein